MPGKGSAARHEYGVQTECEQHRSDKQKDNEERYCNGKIIKSRDHCEDDRDHPQLASVVNTDMSMDSMSFIMVICKLEAEFNVKIPNRQWNKLKTLGQVVDAIEKYQKN